MTTIYQASDLSPITLEETTDTLLVVSIPAAFSGTCTNECVPGIFSRINDLRGVGIDRIIFVCTDGPHAIKAWMKAEGWADEHVVFASDFGSFQYRERVGKLSDEDGKMDLPQVLGNQLRRSYTVYKNGEVTWQYIEPDTGKYTVDIAALISAIS